MIKIVEKRTMEIIAANVRRIRYSYGWTQVDLAESLQRPQSRVSEIERACFPISTDTIDELCDALDIDQITLLTHVPEDSDKSKKSGSI